MFDGLIAAPKRTAPPRFRWLAYSATDKAGIGHPRLTVASA